MRRALLALGLLALAGSAVAQVEAWPAPPVRAPQEDAPEALEPAAEALEPAPEALEPGRPVGPLGGAAPVGGGGPPGPASGPVAGRAPAPAPSADPRAAAPEAPPLLLPELDGPARLLLVLLVLLFSYLGPALLYPGLLGATALGPGRAAAACLTLGAAVALPGVLLVLARARFVGGAPVAWFAQSAHYPLAVGAAALLLALAALASRARGDAP